MQGNAARIRNKYIAPSRREKASGIVRSLHDCASRANPAMQVRYRGGGNLSTSMQRKDNAAGRRRGVEPAAIRLTGVRMPPQGMAPIALWAFLAEG
jgi:hypothetical protein